MKSPMGHILAFCPLERLYADFLKLDPGCGNTEDVLVTTDSFTKYALAVPCRGPDGQHCCPCLEGPVVYALWCIYRRKFTATRGRTFESRFIRELWNPYGISKSHTSAYQPLMNDQVERFNRTLCNLIKSLDTHRRGPKYCLA